MGANDKSSTTAGNRFPYDLVDEMIRRHLANINQSDDSNHGDDGKRDTDGSEL